MSENLPYEERDRQFDDLPLPDQEASWQKMRELLDKDDDDDRILPPVLLRSCLGWGILLLIGLTVAWLVARPERWWNKTIKTEKTSSSYKVQKQVTRENSPNEKTTVSKQPTDEEANLSTNQTQNQTSISKRPEIYFRKNNISFNPKPAKTKNRVTGTKRPASKQDELHLPETSVAEKRHAPSDDKVITEQGDNVKNADTSSKTIHQQENSIAKDSVRKDSLSQSIDSAIQKRTKPSQKKLIVAAGIGLQQQIPIAGQTAVPYSYYGRTGSIADYIPSVFLQLHKSKKWFIMGEFRFGATQFVKEFSYHRNTKFDTSSMNVTVTTMRLKETYYHQLPFSFNYYIVPNFSVGIGGMYSRFYGATAEKETDTWNAVTQTSKSFKEIIPVKHFTDSFLYKTQVHALLQADYQLRRFSFGLRYTKDLQPYIKYTRPDGTIEEQKNQSLQLIARYRIWPGKL